MGMVIVSSLRYKIFFYMTRIVGKTNNATSRRTP